MVTGSEVFKARDRKTNRIVALKKVRMENEKEGVSVKHELLADLHQSGSKINDHVKWSCEMYLPSTHPAHLGATPTHPAHLGATPSTTFSYLGIHGYPDRGVHPMCGWSMDAHSYLDIHGYPDRGVHPMCVCPWMVHGCP